MATEYKYRAYRQRVAGGGDMLVWVERRTWYGRILDFIRRRKPRVHCLPEIIEKAREDSVKKLNEPLFGDKS